MLTPRPPLVIPPAKVDLGSPPPGAPKRFPGTELMGYNYGWTEVSPAFVVSGS